MSGKIYDYFPGGNTSKGFYSYYRYILRQEDARRIICIKGGPGTGKSTLMKKVGTYFKEKDYDIEFHHCSSDNESLDGVVIKKVNLAILDGTAPHLVDPINPGAIDEVLNLGEFWNEGGLEKYREEISYANKEIGKKFEAAYRYLGAAKLIHDNWSSLNFDALNQSSLNKYMYTLKNKIFFEPCTNTGIDRHLFATAFTPKGIVTYIDKLSEEYENIYVFYGGPGTGKNTLLELMYKEALKRGHYVEVLHDPLIPEKIEHVLIPDMKLAFLTSSELNNITLKGNKIYMQTFLSYNTLIKNEKEIKDNMDNFYLLLNKGLSLLSSAKSLHDEMEKYYIENMNFQKLDDVYEALLKKLSSYI